MANSIFCLSCGAIVFEDEIEKGTHKCKRVDYYDDLLKWLEKNKEDLRLYQAREERKAKLFREKYGDQFVQIDESKTLKMTPERLNELIETWKKERDIDEKSGPLYSSKSNMNVSQYISDEFQSTMRERLENGKKEIESSTAKKLEKSKVWFDNSNFESKSGKRNKSQKMHFNINKSRLLNAIFGSLFLVGGIIYFPLFSKLIKSVGFNNEAFIRSVELPLEIFGGFLLLLSLFFHRSSRAVKTASFILVLTISGFYIWHTPTLKSAIVDTISNWKQRISENNQVIKTTPDIVKTPELRQTPIPFKGTIPSPMQKATQNFMSSVHTPTPIITSSPNLAEKLAPILTPRLKPTSQQLLTTPIPMPASTINLQELKAYMLDLINKDRRANGLSSVVIGNNIASQKHAEEMAYNMYISHWGLDGIKPYMRYTLAGGYNYEAENAHLSPYGYTITTLNGVEVSRKVNSKEPKIAISEAEEGWMGSPGHRRNILNKWHKKVNLGLAWDEKGFAAIQQFEGDYVEFLNLPTLSGSILSFQSRIRLGKVFSIVIYYDPPPQSLTPKQLEATYSYSLGTEAGSILPPPPPNSFYTTLKPSDIVANRWFSSPDGSLLVEANIGSILRLGKGVYTIVIWSQINSETIPLTNYSIFVR